MDIVSELVKNIVTTLVSTVTIVVMFFRFLNKERLQHARQISEIIEKTASHVFNNASLEHHVKDLEAAEKANVEYMKESFTQIHSRLDQIYSIIAGLKK